MTEGKKKSQASEVVVCARVCARQGDESLEEEDGRIPTEELTAAGFSLRQSQHSQHACDITHACYAAIQLDLTHTL